MRLNIWKAWLGRLHGKLYLFLRMYNKHSAMIINTLLYFRTPVWAAAVSDHYSCELIDGWSLQVGQIWRQPYFICEEILTRPYSLSNCFVISILLLFFAVGWFIFIFILVLTSSTFEFSFYNRFVVSGENTAIIWIIYRQQTHVEGTRS